MLAEKFGRARFVVACTAFCAVRLREHVPGQEAKWRVLRHGLPDGYARGARLRSADGMSRLVFVGRFVPKKGLDTLIRAAALLRDQGTRFSCHLYGSGDEQPALERLVEAHQLTDVVRFEGPLRNDL